jgi:uncharacterized protein (UPF0303 family)
MKQNNYNLSLSSQHFVESDEFLSEKICCCTIQIRKKIVRKTKRVFVYGQLILSLGNGLAPSQAIGVGLPIVKTTPSIMKSINSNVGLSKKLIIAQVIQQMETKLDFTEKEMNQFYDLGMELRNNSLSQEELITKISNLRGGSFIDVVGAVGLIFAIIILSINDWSLAFQPNPNAILPPHLAHLEWLYGNNYKPGQFGYGKGAGPRSLTVTGLARNAGSEKKDPYDDNGSWDYKKVMTKLDSQTGRKKVEIEMGNQLYTIKNPDCDNAYQLGAKLAEQIYDSIRECDTDICDIAENLGFKADNIKNVKDHVFYNKHYLDRYANLEGGVESKLFDPNIQQALAWKRLETGTHNQDDINWIKR